MNCDWQEIEQPDERGLRRVKCRRCGAVSGKTPSPLERIISKPGCPAARHAGVGENLMRLLKSLGIKPDKCGGTCAELARKMDAGGPQWCRDNREEILAQLNAAYSKLSLLDRGAIAIKATTAGVAIPMLWNGAAEWLLTEAIRRAAEESETESSSPRTEDQSKAPDSR